MAFPTRVRVPPLTSSVIEEFDHLKIQMEDIISATNNFDPNKLIGRGGFGPVFKGELSLLTGPRMVAFKRLDPRLGQGNIEFLKEILMLSNCKHENLVSLLHFSFEGEDRVLVYEYASRGSLDRYLSDGSLSWKQRLHICIGVAHALKYLHDPMKTQQRVLHRDIKSANILLDEQWTAKVSDFGLSKLGPANQPQTFVFTNAVGTPGYCDPIYWEMGFLSKESDVYSFGVVLFEVMCGKLCYQYNNGELIGFLVHDWKKCYDEKKVDDIIFEDLKEEMDPDCLTTFSNIANRCLNRDRRERPTMDEIVKELEVALKQQNNADNSNLVEISKLAVPPLSYGSHAELISLLSKGILVDGGKRWLSINQNKKIHEMISAEQCMDGSSFACHTDKVSRFSNIFRSVVFRFKVEVSARFLSPDIPYTINLIFRHDINKYGIYVPFRYRLQDNIYYQTPSIVHLREDGWLMAELYHLTSYQKEENFKIDFSRQLGTSKNCDFEGIEFRPMEHEIHENLEDKNKVDVQQRPISDADWEQIAWPNYINLINLSKHNVKWTTKKEHYFLLRKGFLIDNGDVTPSKMWISISKKMKIRLMIPARAILVEDPWGKEQWVWKSVSKSRFEMVAESLDKKFLKVSFQIQSELLSHTTSYSCHLIYKLPENCTLLKDSITMYFIDSLDYTPPSFSDPPPHRSFFLVPPPPTPVIQYMVVQKYEIPLHTRKIKGHPKLRKDGWMEVPLFEDSTDATKTIAKNLTFLGSNNMRGLVIQGIEVRLL